MASGPSFSVGSNYVFDRWHAKKQACLLFPIFGGHTDLLFL
jgi:hypothetical protein